MKSPLEQTNTKPTFTQVAGTGADQITIAGGGAAWIDTDLSGTSVPATATSIFIVATPAVANQNVGAGKDDTVALAVAAIAGFGSMLVTGQTTARHCHLRREVNNNVYAIVGYIE